VNPREGHAVSSDPFGTAALRSAVLDAWARNPTRLREDANTEEDHATGYYRDRVVVELAQNAADAAVRAGAPGTLLLRLVEHPGGATLVAANTGEALDGPGVVSLASMRASSKSGSGSTTVGRFGVGFAAVRAVADDIVVRTASGGVRFSVAQTRDALAAVATGPDGAGDLAETVAARGGSLPALRLPFAAGARSPVLAEGDDPLGQLPSAGAGAGAGAGAARDAYATVVELTLRDETAVDEVRRQLAQVDDTLLLALPGLATVEIQHVRCGGAAGAATDEGVADRLLTDVRARWWVAEESGAVPTHLVADRPVEDRDRSTWTIVWALPRETGGTASAEDSASESLAGRPGLGGPRAAAGVVRAPTPTEEPLTVPAVLVATFPLDPSRRHVADGPLATFVAEQAGRVLADLAGQVDDPLSLVPTGLPAGRLDALVRESVTAALREAPLFGGRRARDVVALGPGASTALLEALAPTGLGAVDVAPGRRAAARALDMPVLSVVDVVDALPSGLTPAQWRTLYDALASSADTDRAVREALDGIFVPLADGTTARGPRGLVLPGAEEVDGLLTLPGLRLVHPDAAHPLLRRLGAVDADDPSVLSLAAVEAAVRDASELLLDLDVDAPDDARDRSRSDLSGDDLGPLPGLLALLAGVTAAHGVEPADVPAWWGDLPLPGAGGVWSAARDLAWPGSWAASHLDLDVVDTQALDRQAALVCGVRSTLTVRTVELDTGDADDGLEPGGSGAPDVPGWADYDAYLCTVLGAGTHLDEVPVLLDLDVVHDDAWGEVLRLARQDPEVRRAVVTRVGGSGGSGPTALSYAAWYLRDVLDAPFVVPDEDGAIDPDLLALLPGAPADLDGLRGAGDQRSADGRGGLDGPGSPDALDALDGTDAALLAALGGVVSVGDLAQLLSHPDPVTWDGLFAALERPEVADGVSVALPVARAVWAGLGAAAAAGLELDDLPDVVVAVRGGVCRTVDAQEVLVAVDPMWSQVRWVVPARDVETAEAVADLLDVPVADATTASVQASDDPAEHMVPAPLLALLPGLPGSWLEHADLVVDGQDVDWWVTADGTVHVCTGTSLATTAQGLAQSAGCWTDRHLVEILLADPSRARDVDLARSWEP
jgi:anti-sigma regulatory factor (Ser/Thr protein kinase)